MILANSVDELDLKNSWLTIGVFDGVHRGHQKIIRRLVAGAHAARLPAVVLTFWPHPATVLGDGEVKCLTTSSERADLLEALGVDVVITQRFDRALANTSALDFVTRLKRHLGFDHLLIGYDFALGRGRQGNAARLTEMGAELGHEVEIIPALGDESGVISSTEIRKLVATGDVADAAALLGHPYSLHGPVVHGDGRGRKLGFPTANIDYPPEKILPAHGVYACRVWIDRTAYPAATNVGIRPQFYGSANRPLAEAYILDFDRDIYEEDIRLEFVARLRDEQKFPSVDALIEHMHQDVDRTRQLLAPDLRVQ
ncbi:MAG TPA: bifunctional riboflavin kinase/FAD synthetase [Anaerolineales bacterium]